MAKNETRNNIMSAAINLFATLGYTNTTTKMIADKANCNEVTIFRHFVTKENLFQDAIKYYTDKVDISKKVSYLKELQPSDAIKFVGEEYIKHCFANTIVYKVQMKLQDDIQNIGKLQLSKSYIAGLTTYLTLLKEKGRFDDCPEDTATNFILSILGIFTFHVLANKLSEDEVMALVNKRINDFIKLYDFN